MKIGLIIYGSLDITSGGYLYDRELVGYLRSQGDSVEISSLQRRNYFSNLGDNLSYKLPKYLDLLIEDELVHPSLLSANRGSHSYPIISLVHNLRSSEARPAWQASLSRAIEKKYLETVDGFVFNSETTRDAVRVLVKEEKPNVVASPGGDRLGSLTASTIQVRAMKPGALRVIFLANVTPLKGLHVLLKAIEQLSIEIELDVVGSLNIEPRYARHMQRRSCSLRPNAVVRFHGLLDGAELAQRLNQAQILIIPSFYEGFGIAYLEGMAFGLPAIGTTAGAIPSLIRDTENGFLVAPGDAEALACHLLELALDRDFLARLSLNALRTFQLQPIWQQSMESIRMFLLRALDEHQAMST